LPKLVNRNSSLPDSMKTEVIPLVAETPGSTHAFKRKSKKPINNEGHTIEPISLKIDLKALITVIRRSVIKMYLGDVETLLDDLLVPLVRLDDQTPEHLVPMMTN